MRFTGTTVLKVLNGKIVKESLRVYPARIVIAAEGQILCEHTRIIERSHHLPGRAVYDWRHYLAVIQRKPRPPSYLPQWWARHWRINPLRRLFWIIG